MAPYNLKTHFQKETVSTISLMRVEVFMYKIALTNKSWPPLAHTIMLVHRSLNLFTAIKHVPELDT